MYPPNCFKDKCTYTNGSNSVIDTVRNGNDERGFLTPGYYSDTPRYIVQQLDEWYNVSGHCMINKE